MSSRPADASADVWKAQQKALSQLGPTCRVLYTGRLESINNRIRAMKPQAYGPRDESSSLHAIRKGC